MRTAITSGPYRLSIVFFVLLLSACEHKEGVLPTVRKNWSLLEMKSTYEIPAPAGRTDEGEIDIQLLSDNSLTYDFHIHNLNPGDAITAAHIHLGNAGQNGPVYLNLAPVVNGAGATGKITGLREGQIDTLLNQPVYVNVHSSQVPGGLIRGQLDTEISFAKDVPLSGLNENPAVTTTATGLCILRLTENKILYSTITVNNIESSDTLRVAHIHKAGPRSNGPVRIFLANTINDFGVLKTTTLVDSLYTMMLTDSIYANAHSKLRGSGLVRGQIR